MTDYTLLKTIHSFSENPEYTEVLNALSDKGCSPDDSNALLQNLLDNGLVKGKLEPFCRIRLTPKGVARLKELEDNSRNVVTEKKKNYVFQIALVFLGAAITLVVEHAPAIWDFLVSLFH